MRYCERVKSIGKSSGGGVQRGLSTNRFKEQIKHWKDISSLGAGLRSYQYIVGMDN